MIDASDAAAPNISHGFISSPRTMKATFATIVASALVLGCATPAATRIPPSEIPQPNPSTVAVPFRMDSTLAIDRVPPFQTQPLITWGPPPEGVTHAERIPNYDLQHQVTTIRFDWPRHAVVGTTTLTIGGLRDAAPLSSLVIEAGDMTFKRVAARNTTLKYDYDGHALTVHLATPLRAGQTTSITIDYDGANRTKGAYFRPAKHIV